MRPGDCADPCLADPRLEPRRRLGVDLPAHQAGRRLDHDHIEAQPAQGIGRLEPEQAAADHHGAAHALGSPAQTEQIVEGAVDEHAIVVRTLDGWDERRRPGGEDQAAVGGLPAVARPNELPVAVDGNHPGAGDDTNAEGVAPARPGEREPPGVAVIEPLGEPDAVVGRIRLLADDGDIVAPELVERGQPLDELEPNHAESGHDEASRRAPGTLGHD